MGERTDIAWCDATFNPWWGCTKVSPGCLNCYAEAFDKRTGGSHWGKGQPRRTFGAAHWQGPVKWDRKAAAEGVRRRVFCGSMMDWCDEEAPAGQLDRLWNLIRVTPNLDWLLLTKRAGRIAECLPSDWGQGYRNVWLGVTVEDQGHVEARIAPLIEIPATVRFLSIEPLLGPVYLGLTGNPPGHWSPVGAFLDWIIVGGESGPGRRPFDELWAVSLLYEAKEFEIPFFFKQVGGPRSGTPPTLDELRVREFPESREKGG